MAASCIDDLVPSSYSLYLPSRGGGKWERPGLAGP